METLLLKNDEKGIAAAASILRDGGLVAVPTETVYGLAANALDGNAVRRIFEAKGRPMDNPLIVHVCSVEDIERLSLVAQIPEKARVLFDAFSPGPLTVIMKKGAVIPDEVSAGLSTVAIRIPAHETARALIEKSGCALAAPSANSSGLPSPTTAAHVMKDMDGKIEAVVDGGACSVGVESTVVTVAVDPPRILRPGLVTKEEIEAVIGAVEVDRAVLHQLENAEKASSPGMKYKHYAPKARVILVRGADEAYCRFVNKFYQKDRSVAALCYDEDVFHIDVPCVTLGSKNDSRAQAHGLFDALRRIDEMDGVNTVYARCPKADGVGMALYNRLIRAAAFEVVNLPAARIIGLTGQTGAGKGEVSAILASLGCGIVSADLAAREAVADESVLKQLAGAFENALKPDGSLDRAAVAKAAFSSEREREKLNAITHPRIEEIMLEKARELSVGHKTVVFDASQLFEAGMEVWCDVVVSVIADDATRLSRIMRRDGLSEADARLRMSAQLDEQFFRHHSDAVIENNADLFALRGKVAGILGEVLSR